MVVFKKQWVNSDHRGHYIVGKIAAEWRHDKQNQTTSRILSRIAKNDVNYAAIIKGMITMLHSIKIILENN